MRVSCARSGNRLPCVDAAFCRLYHIARSILSSSGAQRMTMGISIRIYSGAVALLLVSVALAQEQQPSDGLRTAHVQKFGSVVKAPVAWPLIRWAQDSTAFTLRLPQEDSSRP